ncbi:hypothetical protein SLEP1_g53712 [Rubroshorea leprosula]|uniref:Uncharacterized protein n=1 Tax=Rubroshorea leprosula TaxID=152421 RepID=A0AAV5ME37_9ROSI|nr:hypothetical protein SLEP1_g53712 [Rubroshorea leprosula]
MLAFPVAVVESEDEEVGESEGDESDQGKGKRRRV